jgi:hypothetical protein
MGFIRAQDPSVATGNVPSWSYSGLKQMSTCPYSVYLQRVEKHKQPPAPALTRGSEVHQMCEDYLKGIVLEVPEEFSQWTDVLNKLRDLTEQGTCWPEKELAFDKEWEMTGWFSDNTWCRFKADVIVQEDETSYRIIDWKTGRAQGNEFAHAEQLKYYAVALGMAIPEAQFISAQMAYLDHGTQTLEKTFTREEIVYFLPLVTERGLKMTERKTWPATPSDSSCRWCGMQEFCEYSVGKKKKKS